LHAALPSPAVSASWCPMLRVVARALYMHYIRMCTWRFPTITPIRTLFRWLLPNFYYCLKWWDAFLSRGVVIRVRVGSMTGHGSVVCWLCLNI
jgi:hypothetical protein